jgi:hypothetical protein
MPAPATPVAKRGFTSWLSFLITKLACLAYMALAVVSILQVNDAFRSSEYQLDSNTQTLYIPLQSCQLTIITLSNGANVQLLQNGSMHCTAMSYVINSVAGCLSVSIVAVFIYVGLDVWTRRQGTDPSNRSMLYGMAAFLVFSLVQSAVLLWNVYALTNATIHDMTAAFSALSNNAQYGVKDIKVYGHGLPIWKATGAVAIVACVLLLIDWFEHMYCAPAKPRNALAASSMTEKKQLKDGSDHHNRDMQSAPMDVETNHSKTTSTEYPDAPAPSPSQAPTAMPMSPKASFRTLVKKLSENSFNGNKSELEPGWADM